MLTGNRNADNLKASVNYYVSRGVVRRIRKGVYVKEPYKPEELAGRIYSPAYISLESVLVKAGVIFQYSPFITAISYLSRTIIVDGSEISYNKIKNSILINDRGIICENNINRATPERAFLDRLYLSKNYYFDNIGQLDTGAIENLIEIYNSKELEKRVQKVLSITRRTEL